MIVFVVWVVDTVEKERELKVIGRFRLRGLKDLDGALTEQVDEVGVVLVPELFAEQLEEFVDGHGLLR